MIRSFKAIIIKELRENLPWAGLGFLITGGLLAAGLHHDIDSGMSILGDAFMMLCRLMYPIAGLALGLVQVFQDARKGRWQFIAHRPTSGGQLLAGKVFSGTLLYLVSTLLPLMAVIIWVSQPGHVPGPFSWDMTEPALAYVFGGLIWYAGGLLIGLRQARWFGSRLIPLGGAVAGMFAFYLLSWTLADAILITVIASSLLLVGAFGVFRTGGSRLPAWAKPTIAISLAIGWLCVIEISSTLGYAAFQTIFPATVSNQTYRSYHFRDGQVQIWTIVNGRPEKAQDLQGRDVTLPPAQYWTADDQCVATIYSVNDDDGKRRYPAFKNGFLGAQQHILRLSGPNDQWFYVGSRRTIEAYGWNTRRLLGSLGPGGFRGPDQAAEPFPEEMRCSNVVGSTNFISSPQAVYVMDLARNYVSKCFTAQPGDPVLAATSTDYEVQRRSGLSVPTYSYSVIATQSSLHILQDGKPPIAVPLDRALLTSSLQVDRTPSGEVVVAYGLDWPVGTSPVTVFTYDSTGKQVDQITAPKIEEIYHEDFQSDVEEVGALTLAPPLFFALVFISKGTHDVAWHAVPILVGTAVCFAAVCLVMLRARHAKGWRMYLWPPLAACLGLTGIFLLMSMWEKPRGVRCPSCGKRRLLTEADCAACGTATPPPKMEGIEIFQTVECAAL